MMVSLKEAEEVVFHAYHVEKDDVLLYTALQRVYSESWFLSSGVGFTVYSGALLSFCSCRIIAVIGR